MRRLVGLAVALVVAAAGRTAAQASTAEALAQAQRLYEDLEIEQALPILRQVLSPTWSFDVTAAQRVDAFMYLGASLALLGQKDSAVIYFRRAIEQDPFATLDPQRFTPAQRTLFADAGRRALAVGLRPVRSARFDPRTERLSFAIVTSHLTQVSVELRPPAPARSLRLWSGESDGLREVSWDGLGTEGGLGPPGRYELVLIAQSRLVRRSDSARVYFDLRHEGEALEDTLPDLRAGDLLPEQRSAASASADLAKGLAVAAGVLLAGSLASDSLEGTETSLAVAAAGAAAVTGIVAFLHGRSHRELPANVAANAARRAERGTANEAMRGSNAARIARTILLVEPAAGALR